MGTPRVIEGLLSVFDIHITDGANGKELGAIRVLFDFDRKKRVKEFTLFDFGIPPDLRSRIKRWLAQNMDEQKIAYGIKRNRVDAHLN